MKKRAILFAMNEYRTSNSILAGKLPATVNDVKTLNKKLKQLNFDTEEYVDLTLKDFKSKLKSFAQEAPCDSLNIVYFSGHGGHSRGENYIYPVDFGVNLDEKNSIEDSAYNIRNISDEFKREVKLIIIVDACRTNLTPEYSSNYSEMSASKNTYIAYATKFDEPSICNSKMSFFTESLCENILTPNISIDELFISVRASLYLKYNKQISNSINGLMESITLNFQLHKDDIGKAIVEFVDKFGDMYIDKFGCFAGDDLIFIDVAQYYGISVLDAIYKFEVFDSQRYNITMSLTEDHRKLIAFWGMLNNGLKQDEFYTWQYRGRPIRLGEIPPLPFDMQKPMPDEERKIEVDFSIKCVGKSIEINTNLPDNFELYGEINGVNKFNGIEVKNGKAYIPIPDKNMKIEQLDMYSVIATVSGVDMKVVGDRCRNLVGKFVKFDPINGNGIEYHYKSK
ncbi:caspase family protein [Clostridium perfringens]|uniref:caspase family protein n=1 Tax=Clostridium perfringens TaxID=1502 RepID=UPI0023F799EE|nr:caspase family protein [Clostridium perfringens]MDZ5014210.1 hypothetical protein [Clostridium perfringens]WEV07426.1 caspase family protein [Clostridium perfringens B]